MDDKPKISGWNYDEQNKPSDPQLDEIRQQQQMKAAINAVGNSMAQDVKANEEIKDIARQSHAQQPFNTTGAISGSVEYANSTEGLITQVSELVFDSANILSGNKVHGKRALWIVTGIIGVISVAALFWLLVYKK